MQPVACLAPGEGKGGAKGAKRGRRGALKKKVKKTSNQKAPPSQQDCWGALDTQSGSVILLRLPLLRTSKVEGARLHEEPMSPALAADGTAETAAAAHLDRQLEQQQYKYKAVDGGHRSAR